MVKVSDVYQSKWLTAADLHGKRIQVQIENVEVVDVPSFRDKAINVKKFEVSFVGKKKSMLMGARNSKILAASLGDDVEDWTDKVIEVYSEKDDVGGEIKDVLKVQPVENSEVEADGEEDENPGEPEGW